MDKLIKVVVVRYSVLLRRIEQLQQPFPPIMETYASWTLSILQLTINHFNVYGSYTNQV